MTPAEVSLRRQGYAVGPLGLARLSQHAYTGWVVTFMPASGEGDANILLYREDAIRWALDRIEGEKA